METKQMNAANKVDRSIYKFDMLWLGWECDSEGMVMETPDGARYLRIRGLEHSKKESIEVLKDRIEEYTRVLANTKHALNLVQG